MNRLLLMSISFVLTLLVACSSSDGGTDHKESPTSGEAEESADSPAYDYDDTNADNGSPESEPTEPGSSSQRRMVIYNAELSIEVKNAEQIIEQITDNTLRRNGYIVESSTSNYNNDVRSYMQIRIPAQGLTDFLNEVELLSEKVTKRQISGQDVTEEYTDLEARLKAKRVVEERLLQFMKDATKTEDLLQISHDLAVVQEEIEQIEGRKKYLKNRTDFASVDISIIDVSVSVPEIAEEDLQTGEKIKQAFVNSLNMLSQFFSSLLVFLLGYSPFLLPLLLIGGFILYVRKKKRNEE